MTGLIIRCPGLSNEPGLKSFQKKSKIAVKVLNADEFERERKESCCGERLVLLFASDLVDLKTSQKNSKSQINS